MVPTLPPGYIYRMGHIRHTSRARLLGFDGFADQGAERLDEGLMDAGFRRFLVAIGMTYLAGTAYRDTMIYNKVKKVYDVINSDKSRPTPKESRFIDSMRSELVRRLAADPRIPETHRGPILDSIRTIPFRVIDSDNGVLGSEDVYGSTIDLGGLKELLVNYKGASWALKGSTPPGNDYIVLRRKYIDDPNYWTTVVHEIFHYYHDLVVRAAPHGPMLTDYLDPRVSDKAYLRKKIIYLLRGAGLFAGHKSEDQKLDIVARSAVREILASRDYLSSESELWARYKTLEYEVHQTGMTRDISEPLTIDAIHGMLARSAEMTNSLPILAVLDLDRLPEIAEVASGKRRKKVD